jgi:hypothetical protein
MPGNNQSDINTISPILDVGELKQGMKSLNEKSRWLGGIHRYRFDNLALRTTPLNRTAILVNLELRILIKKKNS